MQTADLKNTGLEVKSKSQIVREHAEKHGLVVEEIKLAITEDIDLAADEIGEIIAPGLLMAG